MLEQFLPSVIQYSTEATIYVADNASSDNSISFIQEHFPSVKIIKNSGNYMNTELSNDEPVADGYRLIMGLWYKDIVWAG